VNSAYDRKPKIRNAGQSMAQCAFLNTALKESCARSRSTEASRISLLREDDLAANDCVAHFGKRGGVVHRINS
jgi:hypothetical protein